MVQLLTKVLTRLIKQPGDQKHQEQEMKQHKCSQHLVDKGRQDSGLVVMRPLPFLPQPCNHLMVSVVGRFDQNPASKELWRCCLQESVFRVKEAPRMLQIKEGKQLKGKAKPFSLASLLLPIFPSSNRPIYLHRAISVLL